MKKLVVLALLGVFVMPLTVWQVFAEEKTEQAGTVDAGNKLCPISGDPVSGTSFVVYQGKRYGLCCPMCEKPFLANPEKYLASLAENEKALSEKKTGDSTGHQGMHNM